MKNKLFIGILLSVGLAILCGIFFPNQVLAVSWIGTLFINLLKLIVLPLIFSALVSAIAGMGGIKRLGSIGFYTLGYVLLSVFLAVTIGLLLIDIFKPGIGIPASLILANATPTDIHPIAFSSFLLTLFPPNIIDAAAKFEIMPVVFFSIVFAIACVSVGESAKPVISFFAGLRDVFVKMIIWLMNLTPIGLFSLLGSAIASAELQNKLLESVKGMALFIVVFLFGLFIQFAWQYAVVKFLIKKQPKEFLSASSNALLTAFATSSSMATLPVMMIVAKQQNLRDEVSRFVLPLATTISLSGTAMYEAFSALFFCQILGMHLSVASQIGVFLTAILAGMGATGIPEGGLVTMIMVLRCVNVPTAAIGLLLPFDRILDRFRTMTNVWGSLVCTATVDHFVRQKEMRELEASPKPMLMESA